MTTYTLQTKNSTNYTKQTKHSTDYNNGVGFLEKEDGFYLLLENGGKIILDQSWGARHHTNYTLSTKH